LTTRKISLTILTLTLTTLLLAACGSSEPVQNATPAPNVPQFNKADFKSYAGWAMVAYPDDSKEKMVATLRRMKDSGANVVWISHANPSTSFVAAREIGINPAVWWAHHDPSHFPHVEGVQIVEATRRMLEACREVGVKAVISAGYHTQMGKEWDEKNDGQHRQHPDGKVWKMVEENLPYASPYAPNFQRDMRLYYAWLLHFFANPYRDVIQMINLADEPLGGDYSKWANDEFQRRYGYRFADVGNDPARQQALGEFQSGAMVDFMKIATTLANEYMPEFTFTMSFDGGAMREDVGFPTVEAIFRQAPSNFIPTWDMYARDRGTLKVPVNEKDISRLFHLTRIIGGYSAQYQKPVWFWSAANSWGLGMNISQDGTISDAIANLLYLPMLMQQTGGLLQGVAVWNYNVKTQGLYNYAVGNPNGKASWNEDEMFTQVSRHFALARQMMDATPNGGSPELVFLRSPAWQYRQIGKAVADFWQPQVEWAKLDVLARNNIATAEIAAMPEKFPASWQNLKTIAVLSPAEFLSRQDADRLREWVANGGRLLGTPGVIETVTGGSAAAWNDIPQAQTFGRGQIYVSREAPATLFDTTQAEKYGGFWRELLGLQKLHQGYILRTPTHFLHYNIDVKRVEAADMSGVNLPNPRRYFKNGFVQPVSTEGSSSGKSAPLQRSEFLFAG
jgi:hypothetical protein